MLDEADMVHKVTIVPRGQAGGYAVMLPREDRYFQTKPELLDKIVGLLGGRVAEEIIFGEVSTGAHNDFQRATNIARRMVTEFGMSENSDRFSSVNLKAVKYSWAGISTTSKTTVIRSLTKSIRKFSASLKNVMSVRKPS